MFDVRGEEKPNGWLQTVLIGWVARVERNPRRTLVLCFSTALICLVYSFLRLGFKTGREDLVHPKEAYYQHWKTLEREFGGESDIIVIVDGSDRARMQSAIETMARELRAHPDCFDRVCHKVDSTRLKAKGLYQLDLDELQSIERSLEPLRPLLAGGWSFFSVENILRAAKFRLTATPVRQPLDENGRQIIESSTRTLESFESMLAGGAYQSPWKSMIRHPAMGKDESEYFFSPNGKIVYLQARPLRDESSFTGTAQPVKVARQLLARVQSMYPDLNFGITGMPVLEADEMTAAQETSSKSTMWSLIGVVILFVLFFQALRHPAYAMTALLLAGCWTLGWATLTVGHLNILSSSFLVTLVGLGIDYGIMWFSRYEAFRAKGVSVEEASQRTVMTIGPGIVVGSITTALAFLSTLWSNFLGLREMGWIAGGGIFFCLFGALTVIPAFLALRPATRLKPTKEGSDDRVAIPWLTRHPEWVMASGALVVVICAWNARRVDIDYNLLHMQAAGTPAVEWEKRLIAETGSSAWYALSIAQDPDQARDLRKKFESLPQVGKVVEIASLIPADQDKKTPIIKAIHELTHRLPNASELASLGTGRSSSLLDQLKDAGRGEPRSPSDQILVDRWLHAMSAAKSRLEGIAAGQRDQVLGQFERRAVLDLLSQLKELRDVSTPQPVTAEDLPPTLVERFRGVSGHWLVQVFAGQSVWDLEPLRDFCKAVATVDPKATGKPVLSLGSLSQMIHGYYESAILAAFIVMIAVWFDFRNVRDTALAMIPVALGVLIMLGMMGMLGIDFNPANMIALPLILGIGIDYGVHVLHDSHERDERYQLRWRLAKALFLINAMTVVDFATLTTAQHWGIVSIGLVLMIGVTACLVAATIFLPALLSLMYQGQRPQLTLYRPSVHRRAA